MGEGRGDRALGCGRAAFWAHAGLALGLPIAEIHAETPYFGWEV